MSNNGKRKTIEAFIERDKRRLSRLYTYISKGINIIDPVTTYIAENVTIGRGTTIHPLTIIEEDVTIGKDCRVGPFCRLRSGTKLQDKASIGNFVEVVRSTIGKGSKAKHLTYIGDAAIDENVNVGAGTIIANYDGKQKHKTRIKTGAFIGSGSILVAPVNIGKQAITGAGAVVTKNKHVPDNTIVVGVPAKPLKKKRC
ncbi:MAG: DapH/DapD/GlmU-related protein [Candidatus Omnitrophota bacterium]|jgi:bifunctional UDP-N-acetylglucosamine pyrophosphorylase/glucosamine-1-phosphate N-acetyltransferase